MKALRPYITIALLLLAGCASHEVAPPAAVHGPPNLSDLQLIVESGAAGGVDGAVPTGSPGAAVANHVASMGGVTSFWVCVGCNDAVTGVFILSGALLSAPFVAIETAIRTEDPQEVRQASDAIMPVLADPTWTDRIVKDFSAALRAGGGPEVADTSSTGNVLRLIIDAPLLYIEGTDALPSLRVRGQLAQDGRCAVDRYWAWNGEVEDFLDFGTDQAAPLNVQLATGAHELANAIATDLFLAPDRRHIIYATRGQTNEPPPMATDPHSYENEIASWYGPSPQTTPCGILAKPKSAFVIQ